MPRCWVPVSDDELLAAAARCEGRPLLVAIETGISSRRIRVRRRRLRAEGRWPWPDAPTGRHLGPTVRTSRARAAD